MQTSVRVFLLSLVVSLLSCSAWASQDFDFNYTLGVEAIRSQQYAAAINHLEKAVAAKPGHHKGRYFLGFSLAKAGRKKAALKVFGELLKENAHAYDAMLQKAIVQLDLKQPRQALQQLQAIPKKAPERALAIFYQGLAYQQLEEYATSLPLLKAAAKQDKELGPAARFFTAVGLRAQGEVSRAIELLEKIRHQSPDSPYAGEASHLLAEIEGGGAEKRGIEAALTIGGQYDTNVILEPDAIEVSDESDYRLVGMLALRGNLAPFSAMYSFYQSLHIELTDYNVQYHSITLQAEHQQTGAKHPLLFGIRSSSSFALLSNSLSYFSFTTLLEPYVARRWSDYLNIHLAFQFQFEDFRSLDNARDNVGYALRLGYAADLLKDKLFAGLKIGLGYEDAGREYDLFRFSLEPHLSARVDRFTINVPITIWHEVYGRHSLSREDNRFVMGIDVSRPILAWFSAAVGYQRIFNLSNVPVFDYVRGVFSLFLTGTF